ncbi:DUF1634 domain-containing protein [Paenibacillus tyrfis]|uniref:DUF1634 domain-containing protein n=1 Tax=Paenibacillus tyrfis TaxID=1501230 RepID=UPI000B58AAC0|nr:DUF1634 domain-containing protein [Paenibacillus tyrfis]
MSQGDGREASGRSIVVVELRISQYLRAGVLLSAAVILLGLALFLILGDSGYPGRTFPARLPEIGQGLLQLKPYAVILTGLLMLILTPVFRVGVSILVFLKEKDYLYAGISLLVFLILIVSFLLGKA